MAEFNALRKALEDDTASDQSTVYEPEGLGPIEDWSDDLVVMAAGQGRPEAIAERERRTRSILGAPASIKPSAFLTPKTPAPVVPPASVQQPVGPAKPVIRSKRVSPSEPTISTVQEYSRDPAVYAEAKLLPPLAENQRARPLSNEELAAETARATRLMSEDAGQPIPTASAPVTKDAAAPVTSALPSTGPQTPAGKPESMGTPGLPAPSSEGAGGEASERDLYLARLAAQSAAGFGGMGAGKSIDMGIADTLGERLKQVQALRAKREEQSLEKQKATGFASRLPTLFPGLTQEQQTALRETITAGGSVEDAISLMKQFKGAQVDKEVRQRVNEQALTSAIARYPELATSFDALRSVAGEYGEKDFASMLERAASGKAGFEAKGAATRFMVDKQGRFNQLTPGEVEKQRLQNERLRQQIDLDAKSFKLKEDEALKQTYKDDNEKATKLNELAEKEKGFGGYVTLANDLAELEAAAPGFVTRGEAPEWLTSAQQALGQNWPASTDPRVVRFLGAYGKLANAERHRLYGSAQTAGELKAFLQQLNDNPFSAGPDVLAMQMGGFAANVGRRATNTLNRYSSVFGANVVDRVLGNEFRPLYKDSGVFSSFKDPFPAASAAPAAAGRQAKPEDMPGKKTLWNKKTGQWVRYTPEQEAKARAAGAVED